MTAPEREGWAAVSSWPRRALIGLVRGYRFFLSPWLGRSCRFEPSCSAFALQALARHGAWGGTCLTTGRVMRCHPWCEGGHDPVPAELPRIFSPGRWGRHGRPRPSPKRDVS